MNARRAVIRYSVPIVLAQLVQLLVLVGLVAGCGRIGVRLFTLDGGSPTLVEPKTDAGTYAGRDSGTNVDSGPPPCPVSCENQNGSAECSTGVCELTCSIGYADCDSAGDNGCEIRSVDDPLSCGGCQRSCENPNGSTACSQGLCSPTCASDFADCDGDAMNGCETSLTTMTDCGVCGVSCANPHGAASCAAGRCSASCDPGWGDCDDIAANGCETNLNSDPTHCGICTTACAPGSQICDSGSCQLSSCPIGFGECDSDLGTVCETDVTSSSGNCGFCGNACSIENGSGACAASTCTVAGCNSGYNDCDTLAANGCETLLATSTANCGMCGNACSNAHGTTSCSAGACAPMCSIDWGECDGNRRNGCEASLNTIGNCGMCGHVCPANGGTPQCVAGVCTTVCNLSGSFAMKLSAAATWSGSTYIRSGSGTIVTWAKVQLVQSGTSLTGTITPCGHSVPDRRNALVSESYRISYPNANFARTPPPPATTTSGTLGATAPGSSFTLARSAWMIGLTLPDPVNSSWPSASTIQMVDADGDGKPGIGPTYTNGGGFVYPPVNISRSARAQSDYVAARVVFSLGGTMTSCTQLSGSATMQDAEYRLVGCRISGSSRDCNSTEADALDRNTPDFQPGSASYTMLKIADSGTCADVRAAVP